MVEKLTRIRRAALHWWRSSALTRCSRLWTLPRPIAFIAVVAGISRGSSSICNLRSRRCSRGGIGACNMHRRLCGSCVSSAIRMNWLDTRTWSSVACLLRSSDILRITLHIIATLTSLAGLTVNAARVSVCYRGLLGNTLNASSFCLRSLDFHARYLLIALWGLSQALSLPRRES